MIDVAFGVLAAAALLGTGLAFLYARGAEATPVPWAIPAVHGVIGAAGLGLLALALRRGIGAAAARFGAAGFGITAAGLIALALICGLWIAATRWRGKRPGGGLVGVHATIAIAGFALLLAVVAVV
jgi:hypothetical protein